MKVYDLVNRLMENELKNTRVAEQPWTTVSGLFPYTYKTTEEYVIPLLGYANDALVALHTRFMLREKEAMILTEFPYTLYYLRSEYALSNEDSEERKYIVDSDLTPFTDDVIRIRRVYMFDDEGEAAEMSLDDPEDQYSLFTPEYDCLQITHEHTNRYVSVVYQAKHPVLSEDDLTAPIYLPNTLERALRKYIASEYFMSNGDELSIKKGAMLMAEYDNICSEVVLMDSARTSEVSTNIKFDGRGFV